MTTEKSKDLKGLLDENDDDDEMPFNIEEIGIKIHDILVNIPPPSKETSSLNFQENLSEVEESSDSEDDKDESDDENDEEDEDDDEDDDDDEDGISKEEILRQSKNIAFPEQKAKKRPATPKIVSVLSQKKVVDKADKFDMDTFKTTISGSTSKRKKSLLPTEQDKEEERKRRERDSDDDGNDDDNDNNDNDKMNIDSNNNNKTTTTTTTTTTTSNKIPKKKKKKRFYSQQEIRIPKEVRKLLVEGNEQYTKGNFDLAFSTYAEVVRMLPRLSIPYNILGKIKESQGEMEAALGFYVYGAQMQGSNGDWSSIGVRAKEAGQMETALYCFSRACRNDETDLDSFWEKSLILIQKGFYKRALKILTKLSKYTNGSPQVLQELARVYSHLSQYHDASAMISEVVDEQLLSNKSLDDVSLDSVNLMMELKNKTRNYQDTVTIFNKITAKYGNDSEVPFDLVFNACQAYYSLGTDFGNERGSKLLHSRLLPLDPSEYGDLFTSLADELFALGKYQDALVVYLHLKDTDFDIPSNWVKIADIHRSTKNYEVAIEYFSKANERVPGNVHTTLAMSEIYKEMGDDEKALQILNQSSTISNRNDQSEKELFESTLNELNSKRNAYLNSIKNNSAAAAAAAAAGATNTTSTSGAKESNPIGLDVTKEDVKLFYRHAQAFLNLSKYSQYLGIATALLHGSTDRYIYRRKVGVGKFKKRKRVKRSKNPYSIEMYKHQSEHPYAELLDEEDYFNLLLDSSKIFVHLNRQQEASQYLRYALRNIHFENGLFSHQLKFLTVAVAFNDKNYYLAYKHVKYVCSKKPYSNRVWNLFNKIIVNYGNRSTVQNRFLTKINEKYSDSIPVLIMLGNQNKQTDNARGALFEYIKAYRLCPDDPLINLLISVLILSQVMGRKQANRHRIAITSYSFLYKYYNLRGKSQESLYNLGRGYHQLGIYNMAINYYDMVLDYEDEIDEETGEINKNESLKCEAAFNLSLIYKSKGNTSLANEILKKYIVV
ncbi:hypothetical protein ACTFIW_006120 [Dictyostelium discoideum]